MSVLMEFSIFPVDKGESVSKFVAPVIRNIKMSGFPSQLTSMGTIIETPGIDEALEIIKQSYMILEQDSNRIYSSIKLDIQKDKDFRITGKIDSIESKLKD